MGADWWSKKLGIIPQPAQPGVQAPVAPQQPAGYPGQLLTPQPQYQGLPPTQPPPPPPVPEDEGAVGMADFHRKFEEMKQGLRGTRGGDAVKAGEMNTSCPECGSHNFLPMSKHGKFNSESGRFVPTGGRCFDCGWPVQHPGVPVQGQISGGATH